MSRDMSSGQAENVIRDELQKAVDAAPKMAKGFRTAAELLADAEFTAKISRLLAEGKALEAQRLILARATDDVPQS